MKSPVGSAVVRSAIFGIQLYRHTVSPLRLPTCRFTPTCSQYAIEALSAHGLIKGGWLAIVRLLKCGPWHKGGWDPIPERGGDVPELCADASEYRSEPDAADNGGGAPALQAESETRV